MTQQSSAIFRVNWLSHILVGGLEHVLFFHMLGIIIPTDFHIFQRGRYTTNQYMFGFGNLMLIDSSIVETTNQYLKPTRI